MNTLFFVSVFESDSPQEVGLVKSKLEANGIKAEVGTKDLPPFADPLTILTVSVQLRDEQESFAIIDAWLQETGPNLQDTTPTSD